MGELVSWLDRIAWRGHYTDRGRGPTEVMVYPGKEAKGSSQPRAGPGPPASPPQQRQSPDPVPGPRLAVPGHAASTVLWCSCSPSASTRSWCSNTPVPVHSPHTQSIIYETPIIVLVPSLS